MYGSVRPRRRARVRLTRRGRVVVIVAALLFAGLLVALTAPAVTAAPAPDSAGGAAPVEPTPGVVAVVRPGDTLWSVAARYVPSRDAPGMIEEIRRLNGLSGTTIHPGQRLLLPAR